MLIGKAHALTPSGHPEVMTRAMVLDQEMVREQLGEYEQRWHSGKALLARVGLSLALWGLIAGGIYWVL